MLLALFPLLVGVTILQMKFIGRGAQKSQQSVADSGKLATEAIRCVACVPVTMCVLCLLEMCVNWLRLINLRGSVFE